MGDTRGPRRSIVGRGAAGNPRNRFERIEVEPDELEEVGPEAVYLREYSRSIIARNDSPDIGFDASINPYRGCSHGCSYCIAGDTPILMADGTTRWLENIRVGDEVYGTVRRGSYRRYTKTRVLTHWSSKKRRLWPQGRQSGGTLPEALDRRVPWDAAKPLRLKTRPRKKVVHGV